jgi:hypothetical protein
VSDDRECTAVLITRMYPLDAADAVREVAKAAADASWRLVATADELE